MHDRSDESFTALVLNSPFLDMNYNWFVRKIGLPLASDIALFMPEFSVGPAGDPNYTHALLKSGKGEWEYNETVKTDLRPTQYLGWLRAVMKAQSRVHSKLDIKAPVLVMRSDCSTKSDEWNDDYLRCDGVLNVEQIEEWAPNLGENVTTRIINGGLHDLYLSRKDVRDKAYRETFDFIDSLVKE
jgi:alpha-beta hydrolase superfamily lysophospholipase